MDNTNTQNNDKPKLFRAIVYSGVQSHIHGDQGIDETVVFIQGPTLKEAINLMKVLLSTHWKRPLDSIECYNVFNEIELCKNSILADADIDNSWLLEVGSYNGEAFYCFDFENLAPTWMERIINAKIALEERKAVSRRGGQ